MIRIPVVILLCLFALGCYAQNKIYTLNNKDVSLSLIETGEKNVVFSEITSLKVKKNFIVSPKYDDCIWSIQIRKGTDEATKLELKPENAESMTVKKTPNKLEIIWKDVKVGDMADGFDVLATVRLKGEDTLWNLSIKSHNNEYGLWTIKYPIVGGIDATQPSRVTYPIYGGQFDDKFTGYFESHYPSIYMPMQWLFVTKDNATLYMATHDKKGYDKYFSGGDYGGGKMIFYVRNNPFYMGEPGHDYNQDYDFCLSPIEGDWFDAAKKYRKWGIENKFIPFSKGLTETRKDIPDWYKELPVWIRWEGLDDTVRDKVINFAKYLDVPVATHVYYWSQNSFDTHYPDYLPAIDRFKNDIEKMQEAGIKVVPYTNGRLVDINLSETAKKYGADILVINEKGELEPEVWEHAKALGAENMVICPITPYKDIMLKELGDITQILGVDGFYIDEICVSQAINCFNKEHNHPIGGGNNWIGGYKTFMEDVRREINSHLNEPAIFTSEGGSEPFLFDGWLRCNECDPSLNDSPVSNVIYSGYVQSFGFYYYPNEFEKEKALPAINKTAVALSKGYQLGWGFGYIDYKQYPDFAQYMKEACKARHKAYKFFNLGEMMREVTITSPIPEKEIFFQNFALESNNKYPLVRTISHYYKGKASVTFTNISKESIDITWESTAKSLGLKNKKSYKISEFYPEEKLVFEGDIKGSLTLGPLETRVLIVE
ncbi:MAG: hypothetical protein IJS60_06670 [Abditibacteriota bacterium]|nr:hypothetical protein [Abditibacteriota bacterium]